MTQQPFYPQQYPPQQQFPQQQFPQAPYGGYPQQMPPQYAPTPAQPPAPPLVNGTIDDYYNQPNGGGGPGISWKNKPIGTTYSGRVTRDVTNGDIQQDTDFTSKQPKFYGDGRPVFVMRVPMMADQPTPEFPDGEFVFYVRGQSREELVRAMAEAGCTGAPTAGAHIAVTLVQRKPSRRGGNPANIVQIRYTPAQGGTPAPAAAPVQAQAPVAASPAPVAQPAPQQQYAQQAAAQQYAQQAAAQQYAQQAAAQQYAQQAPAQPYAQQAPAQYVQQPAPQQAPVQQPGMQMPPAQPPVQQYAQASAQQPGMQMPPDFNPAQQELLQRLTAGQAQA